MATIRVSEQTPGVGVTLFFIRFGGSNYEIRKRSRTAGSGRFWHAAGWTISKAMSQPRHLHAPQVRDSRTPLACIAAAK
jgi:hypothetical protein